MKNDSAVMTEGSYKKKIVYFAIPIFFGSLFQQMYSTADSLIVGNFLGSSALAAVSSSGNLIFLLIGFIQGLTIGCSVVIARFIGARDHKMTSLAVHTTVALGLVSSLVLTLVGIFLAPQILRLMSTPEEIMDQSVEFFRMYFFRICRICHVQYACQHFTGIRRQQASRLLSDNRIDHQYFA